MCGVAGFLKGGPVAPDEARADLRRMAEAIAHRGPDDQGEWCDPMAGIGLSHRRLSIVDLSSLGHQPMASAGGRFTVSFNGEIYNHAELRADLSGCGHVFRGSSDTEVLLAACEQWGLDGALRRFRGMFAIALWDAAERALYLVRDRFGEKPLYYGELAGLVVFGSELKALRAHRDWRAEIDRQALTTLLRHGYIPAPYSIFRNVRKVRAGCIVRVRAGRSVSIDEQEYWRPSVVTSGAGRLPDAAAAEMVECVHEALQEAIGLQMVADVPIGAFLSGGIDSSLVVSLMQHASTRAVRTFSISFAEAQFDEGPYARRVARHLGTDHTELRVTPQDAFALLPRLAQVYDEPLADSSQIPTALLCGLTRREVTVSLSGDGGDELFGGYGRYMRGRARWDRLRRIPHPMRASIARLIERMPLPALDALVRPAGALPGLSGRSDLADHLKQRSAQWSARSLPEHYRAFVSYWDPASVLARPAEEPATAMSFRDGWPPGAADIAHMMYVDSLQYLPDDVLVKVDRAAMSVALETRVPLLDPRVAAAAWRIPLEVHLRDGRGKWVLRRLLQRYMPRELIDRPKMGFGVPIARWLRQELRGWAGDLLAPERLRREGYFDAAVVSRRWRQHLDGGANWGPHLWAVLMFEAWLEELGRPRSAPVPAPRVLQRMSPTSMSM